MNESLREVPMENNLFSKIKIIHMVILFMLDQTKLKLRVSL